MSDTSRVEMWMRAHGRTNMTEWDRQPAIDGGNKVTRLARCIGDLKAKGLPIPPSKRIKIGNAWVAEYTLESDGSMVTAASGIERNATAADSGAGTPSSPSLSTSVLATTLAAPPIRHALDNDWDWQDAA